MSKFKALQNDSNTISRCIEAIKDACKYENWIDSFIQEYSKTNNIPTIDVVISLENFKGKNINWQYIKKFNMEPAYYYEDSNGKRLHIAEDSYGNATFRELSIKDFDARLFYKLGEQLDGVKAVKQILTFADKTQNVTLQDKVKYLLYKG